MRPFHAPTCIVALLLLAATLGGCNGDAQSQPPEEEESEALVPVEAAVVETGDISAFFTGTASLEAQDEAAVVAKAGGIVEAVNVEEGSYVEAGAPLATLDDDRSALELARIETQLEKLRRDYERSEALFEKELISAEEHERVRSEYEAEQANRDLAKLEHEYATVRAPISGVISERLIKKGNMVRANEPVFHITDFDPLWAVLHVPERELGRLRPDQAATLRFDALPGETFAGTVDRISPTVDAETGTFRVTVEVRDRTRRLKPGLFGRVQIQYDTRAEALLVPKAAVMEEDDAATVYVVRDSMAFRQTVETGFTDERHVEIRSGLEAGDQVIVTGQNSLRDSAKVEVIQ